MILVGVDFSINSTGVCIQKGNKYHWINFVANYKENNKPFVHHKAMKKFLNVESYSRSVPKTSYIDEQLYKQKNACDLAELISKKIREISGPGESVRIAFEGFAYGAKGRSFIDLIAYNSITKVALIMEFEQEIIVFAPSEIKSFLSGKGNSGKDKMFEAFLQSDDKLLKKDKLSKYSKGLNWTSGDVPKPLDDMIDSYAIVKKLEDHLLTVK